MKRNTAIVLAGVVVVVLASAAASGLAKREAKRLVAWWNTRKRLAMRVDERPFSHLAASQVGYAPRMTKQFTAPRKFNDFRVVREQDGGEVFRGGPPVRSVATDILGDIDTVWIGDFSALDTPGRYRIVIDEGTASFPFDIRADVFAAPVRAIQRWFYYQRAFAPVDARHAEGPWAHPTDAGKAPPGVRAGWHDAGDFSIYSASLNTALYWLLEIWSDFAPAADDLNIPESGNGVPDLLDEARWGLEWLLSVQDPSGGFRNSTCQERYGRYGTNAPQDAAPYVDGEAGTLATARAVGNLAYASAIYARFDRIFAERCLRAARAGYVFLDGHRNESSDGPTCPAYRTDGDAEIGKHVRMFAAAGMLLATGEARFRKDFEENYAELEYDPSYHHPNGFAAQIYLRSAAGDPLRKQAIRERLRLHAETAREDGARHPFQLASRNHWGTIGAGFTRTGAYNVKTCLEDPREARADCEQALANVHYALGRNFLQTCYVSGLPGVTRGHEWAFHHWLATLRAEPHCFPGMVAGGPNAWPEAADVSDPSGWPIPAWGYWGDPAYPRDSRTPLEGRYTDNDSWSTNEVSVDWQASTLYSLYFAAWMAKGRPER